MKSIIRLAAGSLLVAQFASAEVAPQDITYSEYGEIEQSLTGVPGNPAEGEKVMTNRGLGNCIACHAVTALSDYPFHGEVGPILDGVGSYRSAAELRGVVANAKMTYPETVMPAFYKDTGFNRIGDAYTGKAGQDPTVPILTAQQVEDVVAYLMTLTE